MNKTSSLIVLGLLAAVAASCRIDPNAFPDDIERSGRIHTEWSADGRQLKVDTEGQLLFDESESDVTIGPEGGFLRIEESSEGVQRIFQAESSPGQAAPRIFLFNGESRDMQPEDRQWLARIIPEILRETGYDASGRIARLKDRGGSEAVLAEISQIQNGSSLALYLEEFLAGAPLDDAALLRLAGESARISSSGKLADLIRLLAPQQRASAALTLKLVEASRRIESSSYRRQALERIAEERDLDVPSAQTMALAAGEIRSDSEKSAALITLAQRGPKDAAVLAPLIEAAGSIHSSSEKSRVFREILGGRGLPDPVQVLAAQGVATIQSSSEKSLALTELAETLNDKNPEVVSAFLASLESVESSSEQERVLSVFLSRRDLSAKTLSETLAFAESHLPDGALRQRIVAKIRRRLD